MSRNVLQVHPDDDMVVALDNHQVDQNVLINGHPILMKDAIPAKHKFANRDVRAGELLRMYGIVVGRAKTPIKAGALITTENLEHATLEAPSQSIGRQWHRPDVTQWLDREFLGFRRHEGSAGVANYWIVVPMVFCESRNVRVIQDALTRELGYGRDTKYQTLSRQLVRMCREGASPKSILESTVTVTDSNTDDPRVFSNVDGIKFLHHDGGCGGAYDDAISLCGLLAGYINHPNVAGATVLSLGCQKSQVKTLQDQLHERNPHFDKPLYIFDQQSIGSEQELVTRAIKHTLAGLVEANRLRREPVSLENLTIGLECGGSDGFSGISANPAIGHFSDLMVALGGSVILSEFPELAGCEQDLTSRCVHEELANRFISLMSSYDQRATALGSGFDRNPSPGNIKDGLITDAMKSAGAARKGGTSPVVDVLDYPEPVTNRGLNLLCTPGGDVESTTAMAGSGASIQVFSTGLGTPTGNPISPVIKVSSNTTVARRMADVIDLDAGRIIGGQETIEQVGERLMEMVIQTASGRYQTKAQRLGQDDFIPWKRGMSI